MSSSCDETGLNFKMCPSKSVTPCKENSALGYKRMKEQVRIIVQCNASDNQKLKLAFIRKSIKKKLSCPHKHKLHSTSSLV